MLTKTNQFMFDLNMIDHAIVSAIKKSLENEMPEIMEDHNLQERNGYGQFRWNVICAQLRDICQHIGWIDYGICKRRGWKVPVLFYPKLRYLITLMTEDTFADIQRRKSKGKHYLCAASSFNNDVEAQNEQLEMDIPGVASDSSEWIVKSREQLADCIKTSVGDITGHILVIFRERGDKLISVRAARLTHKLEISTEESDWSNYIEKPFSAKELVTPQLHQDDDDDNDILVSLI